MFYIRLRNTGSIEHSGELRLFAAAGILIILLLISELVFLIIGFVRILNTDEVLMKQDVTVMNLSIWL